MKYQEKGDSVCNLHIPFCLLAVTGNWHKNHKAVIQCVPGQMPLPVSYLKVEAGLKLFSVLAPVPGHEMPQVVPGSIFSNSSVASTPNNKDREGQVRSGGCWSDK